MGPRIMLRRFVIIPLCLTFGIGLASAEAQETIASDRPGIGSGSHVLSAGTVQLEVGVAFTSAGLFDSYGLGQTLLRFGLPGLEVQALLNSVVVQRGPGGDAEGVEDLGIGVKARLLEQPDDGLAVSALAAITAPTGAAFVSNDEWVPSAALLADLNLTDRLGVSANLGYQVGVGSIEDVFSVVLTPGISLPGRDAIGVYFGYAGFFAGAGNEHWLEAGITLLASRNLQFDVNGGIETGNNDYFLGFGIATRWVGP
ncbi:MAG: transporter [Gemmatimonadetes bacterium]|nr:transporter [Gemmatimonadota bacterium]